MDWIFRMKTQLGSMILPFMLAPKHLSHTLSFITSKGYIYIYIYDKVVNLFKEEPFGLASAQTYEQKKSYIFYFYWNVRHLLLLLFVQRRRLNAERNLMSKKLALQDVKNAYGAEANASSASNVDELHQEISVCSLILIIPLIIVWTHTHTHTHTYQSVFWSIIISLEYFLESPWGGTREEDVAGKATG